MKFVAKFLTAFFLTAFCASAFAADDFWAAIDKYVAENPLPVVSMQERELQFCSDYGANIGNIQAMHINNVPLAMMITKATAIFGQRDFAIGIVLEIKKLNSTKSGVQMQDEYTADCLYTKLYASIVNKK